MFLLAIEFQTMKPLKWTIVFCLIVLPPSLLWAAKAERLIVISRPTVLAFFTPVSDAELKKDPDTNEALADFQVYAARAKGRLHDAGVDFQVIYASSFAVKAGAKTKTFRAKTGVGYYFVEPGERARVEYGVMTDIDIMQIAGEYFQLKKPPLN